MRRLIIIILASIAAAVVVYAQGTNQVENAKFYITTSIHKQSKSSDLIALTTKVAHLEKLLVENNAKHRSSYVGKPLFDAKKWMAQGEYGYAYAELDKCEKRMKEYGIWKEPKETTVSY